MENLPNLSTLEGSTLRSKVSFSRAHLRLARHALDLDANSSKLSIACFVRWIVTETVLRADLCGHARKRRACVLQTRCQEIPATARFRQLIHLPPRQIVEIATDLHPFERTHLTKVYKIFRSGPREKNLPVTL